jgi:hypothetical protein
VANDDENSRRELRAELIGSLLVLRKRHQASLDLIESHSCELLRLLAEAKALDDMSKQLLEALQGLEEPIPDTERDPEPF